MTQVVGVHIRSYRGITDVVIPLGRTTVLVGANGAGKSSLLEAMGLIPSEEGAAGRRFDAPPIVDWFIELSDRSVLRASVAAALPPEGADRVIGMLDEVLVVRKAWDGHSTVAVNLGRALDTARSAEAVAWRSDLEAVRAGLEHPPEWLLELCRLAQNPPSDRGPFLDLAIAVDGLMVEAPTVVSMWAEPDDISPMLYRHIDRILSAWCEPLGDATLNEALRLFDDGLLSSSHESGLLTPILRTLSELATEMLLPFVARLGSVEVQLLPGPDSAVGEIERLITSAVANEIQGAVPESLARAQRLLRRFGDSEDLHFDVVIRSREPNSNVLLDYSRLGTGMRRWVSGAVDEAARLLRAALSSASFTHDERSEWRSAGTLPTIDRLRDQAARQHRSVPTVRLIDEPLANLEPRVHRDVVVWMRERLADGERLVLSTHNGAALAASRPSDPVSVVGVHRDSGSVVVQPMGRSLNEELLKSGKRLGLSGPELLFTTRAMVLVEGPHDVALLRACCGPQLAERGVIFSVISGSSYAALSNALTSDLQRMVRLPVWVILDSTKDQKLKRADRFSKRGQADETLEATIARLKAEGVSTVRSVPFEPLDILAGIKPSILRTLFPKGSVPDDDVALQQLQAAATGAEVKSIVLGWCKEGSAILNTGDLVSQVTRHARRNRTSVANVWLNSTVSQLLDDLDQRLK